MNWFYKLAKFLAKTWLKRCYGFKVHGIEHAKKVSGGALVASNHTSFLDPEVVSVACPFPVTFIARDTLFKIFMFGRIISWLNAVPIVRGGGNTAMIRRMCELLQEGRKVLMFPEGSRSNTEELSPFKAGLGLLAFYGKSDILPVYVKGTLDVWGRGSKLPKLWGKIHCAFGTPIRIQEFAAMEKRAAQEAISAKVREAIDALRQWIDAGAHGTPP